MQGIPLLSIVWYLLNRKKWTPLHKKKKWIPLSPHFSSQAKIYFTWRRRRNHGLPYSFPAPLFHYFLLIPFHLWLPNKIQENPLKGNPIKDSLLIQMQLQWIWLFALNFSIFVFSNYGWIWMFLLLYSFEQTTPTPSIYLPRSFLELEWLKPS